MNFQAMIPMLAVSNIKASIRFYQRALDFQIVSDPSKIDEWNWLVLKTSASRQATRLMLSETKNGPLLPASENQFHAIYYFYVDDVRVLHSTLLARGFDPLPIDETFYGMREFTIKDPDGHWLSFGQELENNQ